MRTGKFLQIWMIRKVSRWSTNYQYDLKSIRMIWKCLNDMKRALLCRHIFQINEFKLFLLLVLVLKLLSYALLLQIWQCNLDVLFGKFLRDLAVRSDFVVLCVDIWNCSFRALWWRQDPQSHLEKSTKKIQNVAPIYFEQMSTRPYQFKYGQFENLIHQAPVVFIITKNM